MLFDFKDRESTHQNSADRVQALRLVKGDILLIKLAFCFEEISSSLLLESLDS